MSNHRAVGPAARGPGAASRPETMLSALLDQALDPAYAIAARGRTDRGEPRARRSVLVPTVLVCGLILGVAYADTAASAPASERARAALVADVERENARSTELQDRLEQLRVEVSTALAEELTSTEQGREQSDRVAGLEVATAVVQMTGAGLLVTLSDAEPEETVDPVTGATVSSVPEAGRILDLDLQAVVNALWAAGAEAIAINDRRLSSTSSVRTAGEAVLVDFQPVTSPYLVAAIGGGPLAPRFAGSATAARYDAYRQVYGIGFGVEDAPELTVPAAADTDLRYAGPVGQISIGQND